MREPNGTILRIVLLLSVGLVPGTVALVWAPGPGSVVAFAGAVVMTVGWIAWVSRLLADAHHVHNRETALRAELSTLEETVEALSREVRDVRTRDAVTGALNRSGLLLRLNEAVARDARLGKSVGFLLVDIEGFREINLEGGRIGGDAALMRVAHALESATRGTDCVGRIGGDEFGVVLAECDDIGPVVDRIFKTLHATSEGDSTSAVHVSIGAVTIEQPEFGVELQELFRLAEGALASVRGTGGSLCARRTLRAPAERQATSA